MTHALNIPADGWIHGQGRPFEHGTRAQRLGFEPLAADSIAQFRAHALERPDAIAVADGTQQLTFAQVLHASEALAHALRDVPRDRVAFSLLRSDVYVPVIVMGLHLSGVEAVIIDAGRAVEQQAAIFADVRPGLVIVTEINDALPSYAGSTIPKIVVRLNAEGPSLVRPFAPEEVFGIGFTSGSTGRPKGLVATRRSVLKAGFGFINNIGIGPDDVILSPGAPSALGMRDTVAGLFSGARVRFLDMKTAGVGEAFRVMREEGITVLSLVPSAIRGLLQLPGADAAFAGLRALDLSGEPMSRADLEFFRAKLPAGCSINFSLGSTEAMGVSSWTVRDEDVTEARVPIGYVQDDRRIALVDENGAPVPQGEIGELVICDPYVAPGEWREGVLDTTRFPTDPASGYRLYRSGDLVRMRPNGLLDFVGRTDRMVKIRGLRADLGDIEAAMKAAPGVADAVVVVQERDSEHATLIGYAVAKDGAAIDLTVLRRAIADNTSPHMVPTAIHRIDTIPRLFNGKPDLVQLTRGAAGGP